MHTERFNLLVQLMTAIAVVFGLLLVTWELQQTRELTQLQLVYSTLDEYAQERAAYYGSGKRPVDRVTNQ